MPSGRPSGSKIWPRGARVKVEWRPSALKDRAEIFEYLFQRNPYAARELSEALALAGDGLATFPYRGRPGLMRGTRELVTVGPYVLIYRVDDASRTVTIIRVWHGARNR